MLKEILQNLTLNNNIIFPVINENIKHGDMPGDKIQITEEHINKAKTIFSALITEMTKLNTDKIVITICGCSGVGKSETASVLAYYLNYYGIGTYIISGDNYPRRIPICNDAERLQIFRNGGIKGLINSNSYLSEKIFDTLKELQKKEMDADKSNIKKYSWLENYIDSGKKALKDYLGSENEIDFRELENIVFSFKNGKKNIWLRRMGRKDTDLWYNRVDFSEINVLIIEWTHGNSDNYKGADIPILLNSTPQETLTHRKLRNRDGKTDSAFTTMVLEIEQEMLKSQAHKARIILSKKGETLSFSEYEELMRLGGANG